MPPHKKTLTFEVLMASKMLTIVFWVDAMKSVYGYQCLRGTYHLNLQGSTTWHYNPDDHNQQNIRTL
jgi:hypothetical protein